MTSTLSHYTKCIPEILAREKFSVAARAFHKRPDIDRACDVYIAAGRWYESLNKIYETHKQIPSSFQLNYLRGVRSCTELIAEIEQFARMTLDIGTKDYKPGTNPDMDTKIRELDTIVTNSSQFRLLLRQMSGKIGLMKTEKTLEESDF